MNTDNEMKTAYDQEARHIIEALRSGVPSRAVGRYFSEARPAVIKQISDAIEEVREDRGSRGIVIAGRYGEGKTHLLNTTFSMAQDANMVVSFLPLSKETPMNQMYVIYQKIMSNTFLPGHLQPGISRIFEEMSLNSPVAGEMMAYAAKELETDKLYYVLRAYLGTEDDEEKYQLMSDIEGDFIGNPILRKIYRRVFNTPVKFNQNFKKTVHVMDYFCFMSHLFSRLGFDGWVILLDEVELIGRLGKKTRLKAYFNLAEFVKPEKKLEKVFSLLALSASYVDEVIDSKHDYEALEEVFPESGARAKEVLDAMVKAVQLLPLTTEEIEKVMMSVQDFHGKAYNWSPDVTTESVMRATRSGGYLLRTRIRAVIEFFDQLYQYKKAGKTTINELGRETFDAEEVPSLEDVLGGNDD